MERIRKLLEIGSNVAIILVAVLLGYFLVNRYIVQSVTQNGQPATSSESQLKPGTKLSIKNVDFSKSDRNLVLVLSTACHFCSESMPFYQKLAKQNFESKKLRMVAAFPQGVTESLKYLGEKKVTFDEVVKMDPAEALVRGTPTVLLVDRNGVVLESWAGKLTPEKENALESRVFNDVQVVMN